MPLQGSIFVSCFWQDNGVLGCLRNGVVITQYKTLEEVNIIGVFCVFFFIRLRRFLSHYICAASCDSKPQPLPPSLLWKPCTILSWLARRILIMPLRPLGDEMKKGDTTYFSVNKSVIHRYWRRSTPPPPAPSINF